MNEKVIKDKDIENKKEMDIPNIIFLYFLAVIGIILGIYVLKRIIGLTFLYEIEGIIIPISAFIVTILFFRSLGNRIKKLEIPKSKQVAQQIKIIGYLISVLILLSFFKELTTAILTIGTISGIVLGLTLQPVLGNFFAGVLITFTRFVEVGKKVRILSSSIPFGSSLFPAYKFLSVEEVDIGYKGEIIDIDWFFSLLKTEEGKVIRIPNLVLLNSAVVDYREEKFIYSIRVEFPLRMKDDWNLEKLEDEIKRIVKDYNVIEGPYFNEQSDKNYVYIRLRIKAKEGNWQKEKSEVLKRLLDLKNSLEINIDTTKKD
ncbi:MAG: mechanosensitive ion channel family protein [Candidatus Aenigmatarchaeota archaeon]